MKGEWKRGGGVTQKSESLQNGLGGYASCKREEKVCQYFSQKVPTLPIGGGGRRTEKDNQKIKQELIFREKKYVGFFQKNSSWGWRGRNHFSIKWGSIA